MASSMLAGERRWASARRGGMTVLGKVPAPKPLNLPSQRLENHGLGPNVEIVPKGTLSWGNRSSSASNAWSSSMQSPNADGGTSSPSHLSARPSSSGSCTRPSTAEPVSESSVAWGPSSAAGRLGAKSSKEDGFSLSSGDFPTLGSDRDNSVKDIELQDHVSHDHPSSASGRISQTDGKITAPQDVTKSGTNNTWKRDGTRSTEDGIHPSMEKWQGEPQQYYHSNVPPQHFDSWRGPPINAPAGVWYRGPPGGPPFGAPVAPGGFPMEPFPYHRPQVVPVPLAGSQAVPPPGAAPRGPHPKNGDLYRAQMPDAYARPAMPFGPGFYPGPMTFDNYYRPPMGYCNGNEREIPYMGMAAGHPVFNRYPAPSAPDPSYSHGRADGRGSTGKALSEKVEADHLEGPQGPHNIPLKNQKEWDRKEERENWEQNLRSSASHRGKHGLPWISSRKTEWGADDDVEEDIFGEQTTPYENAPHNFDSHSTNTVKVKSLKGGNVKAVNDNWTKKSEIVACFPPEQPKQTPASDRDTSLLAPTNDSAQMQKIEVLNAKVRATDGCHEVPSAYNREEQRSGYQVVEAKFNNSTVEAGSTAGSFERTSASGDFVPVPHEVVVPVGDKISQSAALVPRRAYHGGRRVDHRGKGKFYGQDDDGWQQKFDVITASNIESSNDIHACGSEDTENSVIHSVMDGGQPRAESYDSTEIQAQRAKMRETAKQRALQLQKEEEERTREQKAKALAKLEELNRRTQAGEAGNQKAERTQGTQNAETAQGIGVFQGEQKETHALAEQAMVNLKFQAPGPNLVSASGVVSNDRESGASHHRGSPNISRDLPMETPWASHLEHISHGQSSPLKQDSYNAGTINAFESTDESVSGHKQILCKQKPNDPSQKNSNEKSALIVTVEAPKDLTDVYVNDVTLTEVASSVRASGETNALNTSNIMAEPTTHQRRKSYRRSKHKQRLDEAAVISPILSATLEETNRAKESIETGKSKAVLSVLDSSVSAKIEPDGGVQASEVQSTFHDEAVHSRVSKQWKSQSRRMPRSLQANRIVEKFHSNDNIMWAPVRSQSKVEGAVEASQKSTPESATPAKIDNLVQNSSKGKRAEMERYVPKPVAKELAQQGSIQPVPLSTSPTLEEAAGKAQPESAGSASPPPKSSATGIVGSGVDFKEGDGRHNKQGKAHGTWQQQNFTEPSNRKSVHHGPSSTSNPSKDIQRSTVQNQFVKREVNAPKAESHITRENNTLDSSNMSNVIESAAAGKSLAVKDQITGRGKRYLSKGHKSMGNNNDPEHMNIVTSESAATDVNQTDRTISSKESHSSGERISSHWQPKPNTNSENNQNRGRAAGTGTINVETDRASKRDHRPQRKVHVPPQDDKKNCEVDRPHPDESVPENNMADEPNVGHHQELFRERKPAPVKDVKHHQEFRERKPAPVKGRPYSPSQVPVGVGETAPAAAHTAGHDSRQHNVTAFRERQRQNVHYEYQPVGQNKNSKTEKLVASGDGSNDVAPRYRERNQSQSKRDGGDFHRRQGGPARVDSGHD
ncbi:unnamed protein product [Fraxinus pennsylvanica]|uniref:BAT2 N-terminal domain-containing protein n=1 Tax=Fraxinus pennsylvanica TaxID=56036 RepID=A0AAD2AFT3_9LAMI|nr:unnamed protein product [Fraxinus pennsylvanica]